jgi:hypothetical protein
MRYLLVLLLSIFFLAGCNTANGADTESVNGEEMGTTEEVIEINNETFALDFSGVVYDKENNSLSISYDTKLPEGTTVKLKQYLPNLGPDENYERLFQDIFVEVDAVVKDQKITHTFTNEDVNGTKYVSATYYYKVSIPTNSDTNSFINESYPNESDFEKAFPEFKDSVIENEEEYNSYEIHYDDTTVKLDNAYSLEEILSEYSAEPISYKELEKNPEGHVDAPVMYKGTILEIQEQEVDYEEYGHSNETILRLNVSDDPNEVIYVVYYSLLGTEFVRDDIVTVYGNITGSVTYESVAGYQITIPSLDAVVIE